MSLTFHMTNSRAATVPHRQGELAVHRHGSSGVQPAGLSPDPVAGRAKDADGEVGRFVSPPPDKSLSSMLVQSD